MNKNRVTNITIYGSEGLKNRISLEAKYKRMLYKELIDSLDADQFLILAKLLDSEVDRFSGMGDNHLHNKLLIIDKLLKDSVSTT